MILIQHVYHSSCIVSLKIFFLSLSQNDSAKLSTELWESSVDQHISCQNYSEVQWTSDNVQWTSDDVQWTFCNVQWTCCYLFTIQSMNAICCCVHDTSQKQYTLHFTSSISSMLFIHSETAHHLVSTYEICNNSILNIYWHTSLITGLRYYEQNND